MNESIIFIHTCHSFLSNIMQVKNTLQVCLIKGCIHIVIVMKNVH